MAQMKRKELAMLCKMEDFLTATLKDGVEPLKATMKKPNYSALTAMRQKLKKHMRDPERSVKVASWRVNYTPETERDAVTSVTVCTWLQELFLDQYAGKFEKAGIDGEKLLELDEATLTTMGMRVGDQQKLVQAIEKVTWWFGFGN